MKIKNNLHLSRFYLDNKFCKLRFFSILCRWQRTPIFIKGVKSQKTNFLKPGLDFNFAYGKEPLFLNKGNPFRGSLPSKCCLQHFYSPKVNRQKLKVKSNTGLPTVKVVFNTSVKNSITRNNLIKLCAVQNKSFQKTKYSNNNIRDINQKMTSKEKSVKFRNYLQFLLYQDLKNSKTNSFSNNKKLIEKQATNLYSPYQSFYKVDPIQQQFSNTNIKSYSKQKWGSFFPYRKSFVCYWLLPIVGFVGYLYKGNLSNQDYFFLQNFNSISSHNLVKGNNLISETNKQEKLQNLFSVNLNSLLSKQLNKNKLNSSNLTSLFLQERVPSTYNQSWYCTNLVGSLLNKASEINNLYPTKFYGLPLELFSTNKSEMPLNKSKVFSTQINFLSNDFNLAFGKEALTVNPFRGSLPLAKIKGQLVKEEFTTLASKKHFSKARFITVGRPGLILTNLKASQALNKNSTVFLKLTEFLPTLPKELVKNNLVGIKVEKKSQQIYLSQAKVKLSKAVSDFSSLNKNNSLFVNPILSYKKASLLLDYVGENLNTINQEPLNSNIIFKKKYSNLYLNPMNKFDFSPIKSNLFLPLNTKLCRWQRTPKGVKSLPLMDTFYLNKIIQNNKLIYNSFKGQFSFTSLNTDFSFNNNQDKYLFKRKREKTKLNFLEEMIYFLKNTKKLTLEPTTKLNNVLANPKSNSDKMSDYKAKTLKPLKLTKDQLYVIVLNSLKSSLESFNNLALSTKNITYEPKTLESFENLKETLSPVGTVLKNNILKLNHPLIFSNFDSSVFNNGISDNLGQEVKALPSQDLIKNLTLNKKFLIKANEFSQSSKTGLNNLNKNPYLDFEFLFLPGYSNEITLLNENNYSQQNLFFGFGNNKMNFSVLNKINTEAVIKLNNNYIDFVLAKFKKIVKPCYPFKNIVKINTFLATQNFNDLSANNNSTFIKSLVRKTNKLFSVQNTKRIYSIMRSTLSKKQLKEFSTNKQFFAKNKKSTKIILNSAISEVQKKTFQILQTKIKKEKIKKLFEQKTYSSKFLSKPKTTTNLLKNRVFILKSNRQPLNFDLSKTYFEDNNNIISKENLNKNTNSTNIVNNNLFGSSYFEKLEKRKYSQKKHRRKKQRKETRHRKKRKRFYPRPSWNRYKMYENLLKTFNFANGKEPLKGLPLFRGSLPSAKFVKTNNKQFSETRSSSSHFIDNSKSFKLIDQSLQAKTNKLNNLISNAPLYQNKDFYQIKQSVLAELKRSFWKSYWLRSNLKPYLNNIKFYLKEIEKSSTKETLYLNMIHIIQQSLGLTNSTFSDNGNKVSLNNVLTNNQYILSTDPLLRNTKGLDTQNKWQFLTQINEHNRIMYNFINENLILNIRENLTLNGQFKARPFKGSGQQKLKNLLTLKQNQNMANNPQGNPDFWSKLGKATTSFFTQNSTKYNGNFSNYRIYWSINKTNLGSFKTINKLKSLWINTKNRDQSKANKTKKIIYDMKQNYSSFLNQTSTNKLQLNSSLFLFTSTDTLQNFYLNNFIENKNAILLSNGIKKPNNLFFLRNNSLSLWERSLDKKVKLSESNSLENNILSIDNIEKLKLSLQLTERKFHQKEQKLLSLGFLPNSYSQSTKLKTINNLESLNTPNSFLPGHLKNFSNEINYWWDASKMQFIPNFNTDFCTNFNSISQTINKDNSSILSMNPILSSKMTTIGVMTFLFHFCSFISLISISQIRDLIKFSFIVLSKVSKIYLNFIYSSLDLFINFTKNLGLVRKGSFSSKKIFTLGLENTGRPNFSNKKNILQSSTKAVPFTYKGRFIKTESNSSQQTNPWDKFLEKTTITPNGKIQKTFKMSKNLSNSMLYYFLVNVLKKTSFKNSSSNVSLSYNKTNLNIFYTWYSILFYSSMNALSFSISNLSFLTYSYFLKSLSIVENVVRSIYSFFEKPGELIIDWLAYFFLVEWSSDLTNTIPDTIDTNFFNFLTKFTRSERFPLILTTNFSTDLVNRVVLNNSVNLSLISNPNSIIVPFSLLTGGLIQRRILSIYEIFLNIACRPDTDLIIRHQKGFVFWDIWSDLFITVAENSNINISELSNLKEEQNRLLEKLIESDILETKKNKNQRNFKNSIKDFGTKNLIKSSNNFSINKSKTNILTNLTLGQDLGGLKKVVHSKSGFFFAPKVKDLKLNNITKDSKEFFKATTLPNSLAKNMSKTLIWSSSQFLSYQGKDTELFIDLHPPKSFSHITSIKYSESINQPIGLVLCQVFSGIFYKQVAKNLLVVGPQGDEKSLLIQAIAGETELKIITDNAHRYAMVFRGVAVGIKLLRDVFEALTLHTPCIFLLEDIHAIGERRPFLISDDENTKGIESSICFANRDEIHEKNQVIYQLTKHIVSHYKKPYKGDFSLLIPTNHFCFDLFNSSNGTNIQKRQKSNLTSLSPLSFASKDSVSTNTGENKTTPHDLDSVFAGQKQKLLFSGVKEFDKKDSPNSNNQNHLNSLASSLQLPKNQLLAPPATSPFSVLVLKEEKKLKPKKPVKEFPWSGLPGEQYSNIAKATYSIRVKVALLADIVLSNLSVKLDMITDLLVIIDSVKGNRGFVVFATTHIPYILDPALRRPGRFDETLSLPQIPNLLSRWQLSKSSINLWHYQSGQNSKITKATPLFLNYSEPFSTYPTGITTNLWQSSKIKNFTKQFSLLSINQGESNLTLNYGSFSGDKQQKETSLFTLKNKDQKLTNLISTKYVSQPTNKLSLKSNKKNTLLTLRVYNIVSKIFLALNQSTLTEKWGDFSFSLIHSQNNEGQNTLFGNTLNKVLSKDSLVYTSLYSSPHIFKQHLTILMAGQLGYFLTKSNVITFIHKEEEKNSTFSKAYKFVPNPNVKKSSHQNKQQIGLSKITVFDNTWRTASSLIFSFIQKRWIYSSNSSRKNTVLPLKQSLLFGSPTLNSLFDFGLEGYKTEIPSPPSSNILLPAKRYENYKRTFIYSQLKRKTNTSISETIQLHQQQRLVKRLYKIPLKQYFRSEILTNFNSGGLDKTDLLKNEQNTNNFTSFSNASIILTSLENIQQKPTSINWYFRQRILNRHQNYLSNQWWNGQLQEHNTESTFLSDIDWRYTISSSLPNKANNLIAENQKTQSDSLSKDLFIDFPDSEQYYNPKNQRWVNTSGSWNSWFDFHKTSIAEYSSHYMLECLTNAYKCLDQNRELLDYSVIKILEKGMLNVSLDDEIEILEIFKRFS